MLTIDQQQHWDRAVIFFRWQHHAVGRGAKFAVHNTTLTIHSYFRLEKGCRSNQFLFSMHHI